MVYAGSAIASVAWACSWLADLELDFLSGGGPPLHKRNKKGKPPLWIFQVLVLQKQSLSEISHDPSEIFLVFEVIL